MLLNYPSWYLSDIASVQHTPTSCPGLSTPKTLLKPHTQRVLSALISPLLLAICMQLIFKMSFLHFYICCDGQKTQAVEKNGKFTCKKTYSVKIFTTLGLSAYSKHLVYAIFASPNTERGSLLVQFYTKLYQKTLFRVIPSRIKHHTV